MGLGRNANFRAILDLQLENGSFLPAVELNFKLYIIRYLRNLFSNTRWLSKCLTIDFNGKAIVTAVLYLILSGEVDSKAFGYPRNGVLIDDVFLVSIVEEKQFENGCPGVQALNPEVLFYSPFVP